MSAGAGLHPARSKSSSNTADATTQGQNLETLSRVEARTGADYCRAEFRDVWIAAAEIAEGDLALRRRLPVSPEQQDWVDRSLRDLAGLFGPASDWPTIVPTAQYFPDTFDGSEAAALGLVEQMSGWLRIDPAELQVELFSDPADDDDDPARAALASLQPGHLRPTAAGDYTPLSDGRGLIGLHRQDLTQPLTLVATIGHELCHHLLIGSGHATSTLAEDEGLTDLLTTPVGLGIFAANAQLQHRASSLGGWTTTRLGYLSSETFAYALACRALSLAETRPDWARHLAPNPRGHLSAVLKRLDAD